MNKLLLAIVVFPFIALAEEAPAPPLWENSAELSFLLTSGNTDITTVGLGAASKYRPDPWTVGAKANYLSSRDTGSLKAESFFTEVRGERKITEPLSTFLLGSYLKNRFSGFDSRLGAEGGLSYLLLQQAEHSLTTEAGLGIYKENRVDGTNPSFPTARLGANYKWKFSETSEFETGLSFLDNLQTTSDWRLSNTNSITAIMTSVLSLKASFKVDHLNVPVTGKKKTDTTTTIALVAKF